MKLHTLFLVVSLTILNSCKKKPNTSDGKLQVVTTTSMITDLVTQIGGDAIQVQGIMGSGVDPHLYKASEGDVSKLVEADVIFYNGLHLEGKLVEVFEKMERRNNKTIAVGEALDKKELIGSEYFASNYDPHIWFSVQNWIKAAGFVTKKLKVLDPKNETVFETNSKIYLSKLQALEKHILTKITTLPVEQRILVTAHDAFSYFGKAYEFEVVGLQGLSTATEAGVQDVQNIAQFIINKKVKAIFVESSVPKRTIEALQAAVRSKGSEVNIGGTLFSDALGTPDTDEGTYIGMFKYNINTIIEALQ
ncbi:metal ABC transporter solute-binding protein, Zn/Mn family [Aquimarina sp. W85]|uniref:metal ABC transporter solute-binding protein, Zn/Mn family n=1 Tax=Aquimarina rhodophyticola TaxID=3342246 RepID=UPI00366BA27F